MNKHGRKLADSMKEEYQRLEESKRILGEQCVQKWSKFSLFKEMIDLYEKDPKKARRVATLVNNQEKALKQMRESVYSTAFSNSIRPEHMLKSVYIGTANSKRGDIFTEMALASTDDALFYLHPTYEKTKRGATAGQRIYEKAYPYYDGEQYTGSVGTGDGATLTFTSAAMAPLTLIPFSVRILVNGAVVATDNGSGVLVGATLDTGAPNIVNYTTGVITVTFSAGNAPALGYAIVAIYNWNSELSTNYTELGTVSLELLKTRFSARPMPLGYSISDMTQIMFDTTGLGDAKEMIMTAIGDEHAKARDYRAIAFARQVALSNPMAYFDTDFAANGEISKKSWAQMLLNEIDRVGAVLYDDLKRGQINKVVAGSKATAFMRLHDQWTEDTTDPRTGVYKAGTLAGIDVYTCPADNAMVATDEMILTYKNPQQELDTGIIFGNLTEITAELRYPNFVTEGTLATIEDNKLINSKFIRMLKLQNL